MDVVNYVYGPEIVISPYTNLPIIHSTKTKQIFWCDVCQSKLTNVHTAVQHFSGRTHKAKINAIKNPTKRNKRKQGGLNSNSVEPEGIDIKEPATKKSKKQLEKASDPNLKCDDCNLTFTSTNSALHHFKGKRHALSAAMKIAGKQRPDPSGGGNMGIGYGGMGLVMGLGRGMGRGRDIGFGRGFGMNRNVIYGDGSQAREFVTALQRFYSNQFNNGVYRPMHANTMALGTQRDHLRRFNNKY